jgi:hypothetical protein
LIALAAVAVPAALAAPGAAGPPVASVSVSECSKGLQAADRFVEFRGAMRQVTGSETMWMRFGLRERLGDRPAAPVRVPGLGVWRKSRPGVPRFVHRQQVLELAEGSEYRARVHFRWYDADGNVVEKAVRRSATCRQGGDLPNLVVKRIRAQPVAGSPGLERYEVGSLEPGQGRKVFVNGPTCGRAVRAEADPEDALIESSESDNRLRSRCPLRS